MGDALNEFIEQQPKELAKQLLGLEGRIKGLYVPYADIVAMDQETREKYFTEMQMATLAVLTDKAHDNLLINLNAHENIASLTEALDYSYVTPLRDELTESLFYFTPDRYTPKNQ